MQNESMNGIRRQFGRPTGILGWLIGHLMALKNRERSEWVHELLDPRPADRILEIGYGSGADVRRLSARVAQVTGLDHSEAMHRQASRRNREAIRAGRVDLRLGSATAVFPFADASFDRVYAINVAQFWRDTPLTLAEIRRVLKPGGRVVLAVQPRSKGATAVTSRETGAQLEAALRAAGFAGVELHFHEMKPVPTAAVLGVRPGAA